MTTELATIGENSISTPLTANDLIAWKRLIGNVMDSVMKKNVHYGVIPGTPKPSLWLPGAEALLVTFRLAADLEVEDLSTPDCAKFRVTAKIRSIASGEIVGMGVGECSSDEEKYRWRRAVVAAEWDETPENLRRKKWSSDGRATAQVRTHPADIANTVLQMAVKRAKVSGTKSATGASDFFTTDVEDLVDAGIIEPKPAPRTVATPKAKPAPPPVIDVPEVEPSMDDLNEVMGDEPEPAKPEPVSRPKAWDEIAAKWHSKGVISEKQLGRLYAMAKGNGWTDAKVKALVSEWLEVDMEQIPWGDTYNLLVTWFTENKPS